jgi:peptidylprolyl isomerase
MRFLRHAALSALVMLGSGAAHSAEKIVMELASGKVIIELMPDVAPGHVERVKQLVTEKFYDGVPFHRVIPDFMAQTGDPTGTGTGGSKYPDLRAEFSDTPFLRGTIGAARTDNPDSANSQFFICFNDTGCAHLQGQYTVWGKVVEGMELIDAVKSGGDSIADPDRIVSMTMMQ